MKSICVQTPLGTLEVSEADNLITSIELLSFPENCTETTAPSSALGEQQECSPLLQNAATQIADYFAGTRKAFSLPLDFEQHLLPREKRPSAFRIRVWQELYRIPYGETRSYRDIACAADKPAAVRAVGGANHANPFIIVVPCHRVICADGSLGGYGAGLNIKKALLELERTHR